MTLLLLILPKNCCVLTTGKMIWKSIIYIQFLVFCQVIGSKKIVAIQITIRDFDDQLFGDGDFSKADQVRDSYTTEDFRKKFAGFVNYVNFVGFAILFNLRFR